MGGTFNPQILMEKLSKLNSSQQSIETLSHWCIFHMNKAKFVVDTWARQFHCSRRDQKLAFLYLANDILQNSRRKGVEFVGEFWRVLPDALRDVIKNGDDAGIRAARRLISIWDERKVFGSRGHILKEEFVARQSENSDKTGRQPQPNLKLRQPSGSVMDKVVSDYKMLSGAEVAEDALLSRCTSTISTLEKIVQDLGSAANSGKISGSGSAEKLQGQHASLRECIEQLTALESSRASLVSHLRDVLQEQELKLGRVRSQLQAAQKQSDQVTNIGEHVQLDEQGSSLPPGFTSGDNQASPVVYTRQSPLSTNKAAPAEDDSVKTTAAEVAAKLSASTSSAEMLSLALTSLVSEVTFGNSISSGAQESPADRPLEKRPKLENDSTFYAPPPPLPPSPPPPLPPSPHLDSPQQNTNTTSSSQQMTPDEQPPPPTSSPPPLPPLPQILPPLPRPPQFLPTSGPMANMAFIYGIRPHAQQPFFGPGYVPMAPPMMGMPPYGPPAIPFQNYQVSEGGIYNPSSVPMASMSHQQSS